MDPGIALQGAVFSLSDEQPSPAENFEKQKQ
jgi:hypothetical protein